MYPEHKKISIQRNALEANEIIAKSNKSKFELNKIFVVNLLSSPGSGKTSMLEHIIPVLKNKNIKACVIEGDVETDLDKKRIDALDVPSYQIITKGTCHLDAKMIDKSLLNIDLNNLDILFIENVGNLVCPTSFNLGEDFKAVVLSITEGDDKPLKYPAAFYKSEIMIINKIDLLKVLDSNIEKIKENALSINNKLKIFEVSCKTNEGIKELADYFIDMIFNKKQK
ncbi:MAG: hydrogenase nickel incorporation protein HypB [bacterium]